jgi:hypothetical protein
MAASPSPASRAHAYAVAANAYFGAKATSSQMPLTGKTIMTPIRPVRVLENIPQILTGLRPSPTSRAVVTSGVGAPVGQDDP